MEALTNVIKEKIMKKEYYLPSRSGDDGAPCAIARLVLAQAELAINKNQSKKIYHRIWRFIYFIC